MKKQYINPELNTIAVAPMGVMMSSGSDSSESSVNNNLGLKFQGGKGLLDNAL